MDKRKLSLYIHIPFCVKKCNYCDFTSFAVGADFTAGCGTDRDRYIRALCSEIESYSYLARTHELHTIYIGGGTPSLLPPDDIVRIMYQVKSTFDVADDAEISIEVNPGTFTHEKAETYAQSGINRMSIGLQSTDPAELAALGRIHNYDQFTAAFDTARESGFRNINIDLMSAIPGQDIHSYLRTLERVLKCRPEHISSYSLTVEDGTPLASDETLLAQIPGEDADREMYEATKRILEMSGYHRYEISNYALSGYECRHNIVYWTLGDYIGAGIAAASFVYGRRYTNTRDLGAYMDAMDRYRRDKSHPLYGDSAYQNSEILKKIRETDEEADRDRRMEEFMFLGLRMTCGVSARRFHEKFGCSMYDVYGDVIDRYTTSGYMRSDGGIIWLTDRGIDVSNTVLADFLLE